MSSFISSLIFQFCGRPLRIIFIFISCENINLSGRCIYKSVFRNSQIPIDLSPRSRKGTSRGSLLSDRVVKFTAGSFSFPQLNIQYNWQSQFTLTIHDPHEDSPFYCFIHTLIQSHFPHNYSYSINITTTTHTTKVKSQTWGFLISLSSLVEWKSFFSPFCLSHSEVLVLASP